MNHMVGACRAITDFSEGTLMDNVKKEGKD